MPVEVSLNQFLIPNSFLSLKSVCISKDPFFCFVDDAFPPCLSVRKLRQQFHNVFAYFKFSRQTLTYTTYATVFSELMQCNKSLCDLFPLPSFVFCLFSPVGGWREHQADRTEMPDLRGLKIYPFLLRPGLNSSIWHKSCCLLTCCYH